MTQISRDKLEVITNAFNRLRWQRDDNNKRDCICVYSMTSHGDTRVQLGINWSAIGTVLPEETMIFAESLRKTAELINSINELELDEYWAEEPFVPTKEEYEEECKKVYEMVLNYETGKLIAWLLK